MGDHINVSGSGNTVINRSVVENAFNRVKRYDEGAAEALMQVSEFIHRSQNREAGEIFESFSEELAKPAPKQSLLKSLWQGTMTTLPAIGNLASAVEKIAKLVG